MNLLPPLPTWDSLHVLVIHFPIALLIVVPILIVLGLVVRRLASGMAVAALTLMLLGLVSVYVAVSTGEASGELVLRTPEITAAISQHEELAETTRLVFTILTGIYLLILVGPRLLKRALDRRVNVALQGSFLVLYAAGLLVLVNTAHQGGILVHGLGVHALLPEEAVSAPAASNGSADIELQPASLDRLELEND